MNIRDKAEYDAAATRANAISDAPEGTPEARELARLVAAIRAWDEAHKGEQSHGPEPVSGLTRPDDLSVSGLPGNLGKLHLD
jgi:hypothetical protein